MQEPEFITNNAGQSPSDGSEAALDSSKPNENACDEDKNDPSTPDNVSLERRTVESHGRRSMVYLHKPIGKVTADTEIT